LPYGFVTAEVAPLKGTNVNEIDEIAQLLCGKVDAANVTDQQSSVMRLGSLVVSHLLAQKGLDPVFQITCRDRNRIALQSDLLSAATLGIKNVLALTGDVPALGDHPQAKPVYDINTFSGFMKRVEAFNVPVLAGIIPLKSDGMARYMNKHVAGVFVPEKLIKKMADASDKTRMGIEIAADLIGKLKDICHGVHIMAIGWEKKVPEILAAAGI
jgi:5,10-methylenetetrahydrofolate reductase